MLACRRPVRWQAFLWVMGHRRQPVLGAWVRGCLPDQKVRLAKLNDLFVKE